jgi:hypothetical protein
MVNTYFKRYDGLSGCANTSPNNEKMEEEVHGKQEDEDKMANLEPRVRKEYNDENAESIWLRFNVKFGMWGGSRNREGGGYLGCASEKVRF